MEAFHGVSFKTHPQTASSVPRFDPSAGCRRHQSWLPGCSSRAFARARRQGLQRRASASARAGAPSLASEKLTTMYTICAFRHAHHTLKGGWQKRWGGASRAPSPRIGRILHKMALHLSPAFPPLHLLHKNTRLLPVKGEEEPSESYILDCSLILSSWSYAQRPRLCPPPHLKWGEVAFFFFFSQFHAPPCERANGALYICGNPHGQDPAFRAPGLRAQRSRRNLGIRLDPLWLMPPFAGSNPKKKN